MTLLIMVSYESRYWPLESIRFMVRLSNLTLLYISCVLAVLIYLVNIYLQIYKHHVYPNGNHIGSICQWDISSR